MKVRIFSFFLCLALLLSLAACSPRQPDPSLPAAGGSTCAPAADCSHIDADGDHFCDRCRGWLLVTLDVLSINDLHGKFNASSTQPGVAGLTGYLHALPGNTLLLAAGDIWQGSAESNLTAGNLLTEWMNGLGFAAMTLGNHEFDWGQEAIAANAALADFPLLAINIYTRDTNQPVDYCQGSVLVERGGLQIGIIGAIGDCYSSVSPDKTRDIYFKTGQELTNLVKDEATRLRSQGADLILYALHDGYGKSMSTAGSVASGPLSGYYDDSLSNGYVDLVLEGHTHQSYVFTDRFGVYHLQGGGENDGLSHARLTYDLGTKTVSQVEADYIPHSEYADYTPHPSVQALLSQYAQQLAPGEQILGVSDRYQSSQTLRQLIARLYFEAGQERWGQDYSIVLGGGFISIRNPWSIEPGQVTYGALQSLFPFDNQLVLCAVKGDSLLRNFFHNNNGNYFIHYEDYGAQVLETIRPQETYYIVTDTYCAYYPRNELTVVAEYDPGVYARDLLADYISQGGLENDPMPTERTLTDIPTLLQLCADLQPGAVSAERYFVQGTIVSIANDKYGNMTIADEAGRQIYIYGMYDTSGTVRYDAMDAPPQVGDTVVLWGALQHYVPAGGSAVYELVEARLAERL